MLTIENPETERLAAEVARLAGIMAAKRTGELIPLCHPLGLDAAELSFDVEDDVTLRILATVRTNARTGVEMEALTAVSVALLTVYDMAKAMDRGMEISDISLAQKSGGVGGEYARLVDSGPAPYRPGSRTEG